jgi:hypothetical protein
MTTMSTVAFLPTEMILMAEFCAELVRQGVVFRAYNRGGEFLVEFTGGF